MEDRQLRESIINHMLLEVLDLKIKAREGKAERYSISLQVCKNILARLEELEKGEVSELTKKIYS